MAIDLPEVLPGPLVTLRRYRLSDAPAVKASVAASLAELRPWMPWAQEPPTDQSSLEFVERSAANFRGSEGDAGAGNFAITLTQGGDYVGSCGLMPRAGPGALEIGYWVDT